MGKRTNQPRVMGGNTNKWPLAAHHSIPKIARRWQTRISDETQSRILQGEIDDECAPQPCVSESTARERAGK